LNAASGRVWQELGVIATGVGATGDKVRFADINGMFLSPHRTDRSDHGRILNRE